MRDKKAAMTEDEKAMLRTDIRTALNYMVEYDPVVRSSPTNLESWKKVQASYEAFLRRIVLPPSTSPEG